MRVLVAGCAGFIGFHLVSRLLDEGHEVVGLDNISSGSQRNADDLSKRRGFQFIKHDIVEPLPVKGPFSTIFDLACPASPLDFRDKSLEILAVCSRGLWNLLDLARDCNAIILHTSTSEVYGDPKEHPQRETYWGNVNPIGKRACYDEGKRFGEALMVSHRARFGTQTRIARIFNTYGPRMRADDGRALPNFINQALQHQPLTVHGDGSQTRSFCFVTDMVDGLLRLARSEVVDPVNLGNPQEISMLDTAREVIRLIGSRSTITHLPPVPDDPHLRKPDITRARELLGWSPRIERDEGFAKTIEWYRGEPQT